MTVYIVMHWDYDDSYPEAVFANEPDATIYAAEEDEKEHKRRSGINHTVIALEVK